MKRPQKPIYEGSITEDYYTKNPAAVALGSIKSKKKSKSSRKNGKLGGRPRLRPTPPQVPGPTGEREK